MFVERSAKGRRPVIAAWTSPQYPTQLELPDSDPAVLEYLRRTPLSQKLAAIGLTIDDVAQAATRLGVYVDRSTDGGGTRR
jgi:hypothetical protein